MNDIVFVSPSLYLLSSDDRDWQSATCKPGYVPILRSDLYKFQQALDKVIVEVNKKKQSFAYRNAETLPDNSENRDDKGNDSTGKLQGKFQELKQFLPISLKQQLHTVSLQNFAAKYSCKQLEKFLDKLDEVTGERLGIETNVVSAFSFVTSLDTLSLFIRCCELPEFGKVVLYWSTLVAHWVRSSDGYDEKLAIHHDENTKRYVADLTKNLKEHGKIDEADIQADVDALKKYLEELSQEPQEVKADEMTSIDYAVDVSTLSDLPRDSLDQLCKDIVEFRTRVLTIEREKRSKESYEEGKRRKQQLMKVFERIKKSQGDTIQQTLDEEQEDEEDDEFDGEDDWNLEKSRLEREREESDKRASQLLDKLNSYVAPKFSSMRKQVSRMTDYENYLVKERTLYLKELLHLANDAYYDHHRVFKEEEERRDAEDRELLRVVPEQRDEKFLEVLDNQEQTSNEDTAQKQQHAEGKIKLAFRKAVEKPQESEEEDQEEDREEEQEEEQEEEHKGGHKMEQEEDTTDSPPDLLPYDDSELAERLQKLRDSQIVDELVKEYLGVYEEELVEYIIKHIKEYKSKIGLLQELHETFDDDSEAIVARIWRGLV